ncbi:MAG TPA: hypothetical protein VFY86_15500 [Nocardioides sp.]|nr:hypothetical protein [uncultured Nocardioides sp.]HEX5987930.1 hypothetical protein [Nocardioides sp.]
MRASWVWSSAAALVVGSLLLVLAFAVNPLSQDVDPTAALRSAERSNGRWLGMAAIMFIASVCLTFGVPSVLTLLTGRGHGVGVVGAGLFAIGTIGLSSYAMVLVVVRALVLRDLLTPKDVASLMNDDAVAVFLGSWITAFLLGLVLLSAALFMARTVPMWVPVLVLVSLASQLVLGALGDFGTVLQFLALAVALTGVSMSAARAAQEPSVTHLVAGHRES